MINVTRTTSFDDLLDECYPVLRIGDCTFYPSQILADCDPIAYDLMRNEHLDALHRDDALRCFACGYQLDADMEMDIVDGEPIHGNKADCGNGSSCCAKPLLMIHCKGCDGYSEPHDFLTCSRCGSDQ